jgi:SHS2 domain-containing protein
LPAGKQLKKFRLLDYMSDALVQSYGRTLEEGFSNAASAMTAVMVDLRRVSPTPLTREVVAEGFDEESLLYNWLEEVLVKKDIDQEIFRSSRVKIKRTSKGLSLRGTLHGESVDARRHVFKCDVKAITYHEMSITRKDGRYTLRFLLDL